LEITCSLGFDICDFKFAENGQKIACQIPICPGVNFHENGGIK